MTWSQKIYITFKMGGSLNCTLLDLGYWVKFLDNDSTFAEVIRSLLIDLGFAGCVSEHDPPLGFPAIGSVEFV